MRAVHTQSIRSAAAMLAVTVGLTATLAACAPEPVETAEPTPTPSPTVEPYAGPVLFDGDELEWLLPTSAEIAELVSGATDFTPPSDELLQISDGYGGIEPEICGALYREQSLLSIAARTMTWSTPAVTEGRVDDIVALQFADEAQAQARMDELLAATPPCGEFTAGGPSSWTSVTSDGEDGTRALVGLLTTDLIDATWSYVYGYVSVGNVLVVLRSTHMPDTPVDMTAMADLLRATASDARAELIAKLTAAPPVEPEEQATDAAAPWSEWAITGSGVGPILLGTPLEEAIAAIPGVTVADAPYPNGPRTLSSADGLSSLQLLPGADGTVEAITVGATADWDENSVDGATAPSAKGVRVGDMVSTAEAAYPGGTQVRVVSSGQYAYWAQDRNGHLIVFHTTMLDAEATDAEIIGITVQDTSRWGGPSAG